MELSAAYEIVRRAWERNRLPHAYLVLGNPREEGREFSDKVAQLLLCENRDQAPCGFCNSCMQVQDHTHVDSIHIEPESKSRKIVVDRIRDELIEWAVQTSYLGGWKLATISFADCMNQEASNAFLKTLEEPPEKTVFLLVTNNPGMLLPTIVSRCQTIDLNTGKQAVPEQWRTRVGEIMSQHTSATELRAFATAARFTELFDEIKGIAEDQALEEKKSATDFNISKDVLEGWIGARAKEMRTYVYLALKDWYRDLLIVATAGAGQPLFFEEYRSVIEARGDKLTPETAIACINQIDELIVYLDERHIRPDLALNYWFGRLK